MKTLKVYLLAFVLALGVIYLQKEWLFSFLPAANASYLLPTKFNYFFSAFILGLIFGSFGCFSCSLGVFWGSLAEANKKIDIFWRNFVFHFYRQVGIFLFAFCGDLVFAKIKHFSLYLASLLAGAIMIYLGLRLFILPAECRRQKEKRSSFIYALWGFFWSGICAGEALGFLLPFWELDSSALSKAFILLLFSLAALLVPLALTWALIFFRQQLVRVFRKSEAIFRLSGGFYLVIVGSIFLKNFFLR